MSILYFQHARSHIKRYGRSLCRRPLVYTDTNTHTHIHLYIIHIFAVVASAICILSS